MRVSNLFMLLALVGCITTQASNNNETIRKLSAELKSAQNVRNVASFFCMPFTCPLAIVEMFADDDDEADDKEAELRWAEKDLKANYNKLKRKPKEYNRKLKEIEEKREALRRCEFGISLALDELWCNIVEAGIAKVSESCCRGKEYIPTYVLEKRLEKLKK